MVQASMGSPWMAYRALECTHVVPTYFLCRNTVEPEDWFRELQSPPQPKEQSYDLTFPLNR